MAVKVGPIFGNDPGRSILLPAFSGDVSLVFRLSADEKRSSMTNRIVKYFYKIGVDWKDLFASRAQMREPIQKYIGLVWPQCINHPAVRLPDVVIEIRDADREKLAWTICHEGVFAEYLQTLRPMHEFSHASIPSLPLDSLRLTTSLPGRSDTRVVEMKNTQVLGPPARTYGKFVLKMSSFLSYLEKSWRDHCHPLAHELSTILALPAHPNIISPPVALISTDVSVMPFQRTRLVFYGFLLPYHAKGSLWDAIMNSRAAQGRIALRMRAKWAYEIASALSLVHSSGQYHMDIKPTNVLLVSDQNAVLIDWEQCGASAFYLAPEADGSWDLVGVRSSEGFVTGDEGERLTYTKYLGPPRENTSPFSNGPRWDVFKIWQRERPAALEAAEMYSLGRTLWMLMDGAVDENVPLDRNIFKAKPIIGSKEADDVPHRWKRFIETCVDQDPNLRPSFSQATDFWREESNPLSEQTPRVAFQERDGRCSTDAYSGRIWPGS